MTNSALSRAVSIRPRAPAPRKKARLPVDRRRSVMRTRQNTASTPPTPLAMKTPPMYAKLYVTGYASPVRQTFTFRAGRAYRSPGARLAPASDPRTTMGVDDGISADASRHRGRGDQHALRRGGRGPARRVPARQPDLVLPVARRPAGRSPSRAAADRRGPDRHGGVRETAHRLPPQRSHRAPC